jgi:hypothetical protein
MTYHIGDNPQALASVIEGLGGKIVDDGRLSFPVERLHAAVPKLDAMGVVIKKVGFSREEVPGSTNNKVWDVATFTAHKKPTEPPKMKNVGATNGLGTC